MILAIQNCEIENFGLYEEYLRAQKIDLKVVHAYRQCILPPIETIDALFVGGTPVAAYASDKPRFLQQEMEYLQNAIAIGKPCLGICCGAQMLVQLLGAPVRKCKSKEIGGYRVQLTAEGLNDPFLRGFPPVFPVFHWHGDAFEIPTGAQLMVEGDHCRNQLFRRGNVVGILFHLEITGDAASLWADQYAEELAEVGKSKAQVIAECREREQAMRPLADQLIRNFTKLVL